MIETLKSLAITTGANKVIYDRRHMQNILTDDHGHQYLALIDELESITMRVVNNGVDDNLPIRIAFVYPVDFQETAEKNAAVMNATLVLCRKYLIGLVKTGLFKKNITANVVKFQERQTDAGLIGWQMTINLQLLEGYAEC